MTFPGFFQTGAEISIGLAGFSGLLWFLAHAARQFARMLFNQPRAEAKPRDD